MTAIESVVSVSLDSLGQHTSPELPHPSPMGASEELSEQFLNALGDMKSNMTEKVDSINTMFTGEELTPTQLMEAQHKLAQVTMQQELISKGVSKTIQNIDTLIKAQ